LPFKILLLYVLWVALKLVDCVVDPLVVNPASPNISPLFLTPHPLI
jgi:hypothetical protein